MKLAFVGTHGVGKSTLVKYLGFYFGREGINTSEIAEGVKPIAALGFPFNEDTTFETQEIIQYHQRQEEMVIEEWTRQGRIAHGILDRTVIDNYAYMENKFPERARKRLFSATRIWTREHPYGKIWLVPVWNTEGPIADNNFRATRKGFQQAIDERIVNLLHEFDVEYETIPAEIFRTPPPEQDVLLYQFFHPRLSNLPRALSNPQASGF